MNDSPAGTSSWESLDWEVLDRLRATFLSAARTEGPYWHTITDLETYDFTYGERIGWKWDAVLRTLRARGWSPPGGTVLDWGCGSGIAGRRVVAAFGAGLFRRLVLHDHSPLAVEYAEHRARREFPDLPAERARVRFLRGDEPVALLVVSHVVNELDDIGRAELTQLLARAQAVLWVEPGTHEASRGLVAFRESARASGFHPVAPCPHALACGMLAPGAERHWCHFFADSPPGVHADSGWVRFAQRAGIDLRALPYSFLVLDRRPSQGSPVATPEPDRFAPEPGRLPTVGGPFLPDPSMGKPARILGHPRIYKGYAKLFACSADGVREVTLQKRDAPDVFKSLKRGDEGGSTEWLIDDDKLRPAS